MLDHLDMPTIAMVGGCVLLFLLACVLMLGGRRRRVDRSAPEARRTSFHCAVIDPAIAAHGRAAWERAPSAGSVVHEVADDEVVDVIDVAAVTDHTSIGYAPVPPPHRAQRFPRGSTPGIATALQAPGSLPARPLGWGVPVAPSVTARMRATRRG